MPVNTQRFLDQFGRAALAGNAAVLVGAGLSKAAAKKFPDWPELIEPLRAEAQVPSKLADLPLIAEYYEQDKGRSKLEAHIANALTRVRLSTSSRAHQLLAELPVAEFWTTNYDRTLENAIRTASLIVDDNGFADRLQPGHKRIIKMHGSLAQDGSWEAIPTITRGDYERYELNHPRAWAALKATFLTRSMLFIGFSFADPNIEVFLRLARTLRFPDAEHFAILRRPRGAAPANFHRHRVKDLERSGVGVIEIDEYDELVPLLELTIRRCRPPHLFVSGSGDSVHQEAQKLGRRLASLDEITIVSLAGNAGRAVSYGFAHGLRQRSHYNADRVRFLFRSKHETAGTPPPAPDERTGVAVYTDWDVQTLRREAIDGSRAIVVLGGGDRTLKEAREARKLGVPVVPLPTTGGAAEVVWKAMLSEPDGIALGGEPVRNDQLRALADPDRRRHLPAAMRLIRQAMYL